MSCLFYSSLENNKSTKSNDTIPTQGSTLSEKFQAIQEKLQISVQQQQQNTTYQNIQHIIWT